MKDEQIFLGGFLGVLILSLVVIVCIVVKREDAASALSHAASTARGYTVAGECVRCGRDCRDYPARFRRHSPATSSGYMAPPRKNYKVTEDGLVCDECIESARRRLFQPEAKRSHTEIAIVSTAAFLLAVALLVAVARMHGWTKRITEAMEAPIFSALAYIVGVLLCRANADGGGNLVGAIGVVTLFFSCLGLSALLFSYVLGFIPKTAHEKIMRWTGGETPRGVLLAFVAAPFGFVIVGGAAIALFSLGLYLSGGGFVR